MIATAPERSSESGRFARALAALPDAVTAAAYALAWWAPLHFGADTVKNLMLLMLIEFLVVHSGGFIGSTVLSDTLSRRAKSLTILGFGSFYMLFAGAFSLGFHSWWPTLSFLWLLLAKFASVWLMPLPRAAEVQRLTTQWGISVLFYLLAVFVGVLLPLPRLGLGADTVPMLGLTGSGLWIEQPHTVIASGMIYFAAVAWSKWAYRPEWAKNFKPVQNE
jgi:hypothetical protein